MCLKTAILWALITIILLVVFKNPFTTLFSGDPVILDIITKAYPVMLVYVFIDCV